MRKISGKDELFDFLIDRLLKNPAESNGIGRLIFEMFTGIKKQFNTCAEHGLRMLLKKFKSSGDEEKNENELIFNCLSVTIQSMANHTDKQHASVVWTSLYATIDDFKTEPIKFYYVVKLLSLFIAHKDCKLVENSDLLLENLCKIADVDCENNGDDELRKKLTESLFDIGKTVLLSENLKFSIDKLSSLPAKLYQPKYDLDCVCALTKQLFDWEHFRNILLPNLINYFDLHRAAEQNATEKRFLNLIGLYLARLNVIDIDTLYLKPSESSTTTTKNINLVDHLIAAKELSDFNRLFGEKRYSSSGLLKKLAAYAKSLLDKSNLITLATKNQSDLIELLVGAPFLFQDSEEIAERIYSVCEQFQQLLNQHLNVNSNANANLNDLEALSFSYSITVWSLVLNKKIKNQFAKEIKLCDKVVDFLVELKRLGDKLLDEKNGSFEIVQRSLKHHLRALNFILISIRLQSAADEKYQQYFRITLEKLFDLLKNQLASPYHEVKK